MYPVPLRVTNATRGKILADRAEEARRPLQRLKGLLGRAELQLGEALHIVPCNSIHTLFMRMAIDAAFLDAQGVVLEIYGALPPWRVTRVHFRARSVLELPAGTLQASGTEVGDRLQFEPN
jgi:uncharacterized protein